MSIRRIRQAFREGRYTYSSHALEELDEDQLTDSDVFQTVMRGKVVGKPIDDPSGTRFVIRGIATSQDCEIEIVCRFLTTAILRIITVYVVEE